MNYLKGRNCTENPTQYMSARMDFFNNHSKETHIFFEAFLSPPSHLSDKIRLILSEFNSFNESMFPCLWNCILLYQYTCLSCVCLWRYCPCNRTCTCFVHCQWIPCKRTCHRHPAPHDHIGWCSGDCIVSWHCCPIPAYLWYLQVSSVPHSLLPRNW